MAAASAWSCISAGDSCCTETVPLGETVVTWPACEIVAMMSPAWFRRTKDPTRPSDSWMTAKLVVPLLASISALTSVPRMPIVATGVPTRISPLLAIWPARKVTEPWTMLSSAEFCAPPAW